MSDPPSDDLEERPSITIAHVHHGTSHDYWAATSKRAACRLLVEEYLTHQMETDRIQSLFGPSLRARIERHFDDENYVRAVRIYIRSLEAYPYPSPTIWFGEVPLHS